MPGKVLFNQKRCVACHGTDPSGFIKARFTDKGRTVAAADVIKQLRTPAQNMPSFSTTQVSDAEAGQIADYFKSVQSAAAPAPAAAPATLPKAGGEATSRTWAMLLILAGLSLLGIGVGFSAFVRRRA
jgi:mono/diheme cytochrome c family protein